MNFFQILTLLILGVILAQHAEAKRGGCKVEPNEVYLDDDWLDTQGPKGWFAVMGSKMQKAKPGQRDAPRENKRLGKKRCWSAQVKSPVGAIPFPMGCRYDESQKQTCALKTKGTPVHKFVRYFGEFTATMTDNSTFFVAFGCLLGKSDYWVALSPEKDGIDPETKEAILTHIEDNGFDRKNQKSKKDLVSIEKMKMVKCRKHKSGRSDDVIPGEEDKTTKFDDKKKK